LSSKNSFSLIIVKRQHVNVSTKYWSVVNESDVKQTKSISNRLNPFSDKIGNNKNIHTTCKAALPSRAGTTKHVYKKRDTKQAQHQEGANNSRAKWITNPCQDDDRHENTTWKYKKVKTKCITTKYVTPCIPTENFHTKPIGAEMPKGAEKTLQSESANQKEGR